MVCYMLFKPVCKFYQKLGGANEAVIRMLISIGRLVIKMRNADFTHETSVRKMYLHSLKR